MKLTIVSLLLSFWSVASASPTFNQAVSTPKQVLGYELGDRYTSHALIERYVLALGQTASDRVRVFSYGETYEGRTLYLVVISSVENLARLDEIKSNSRSLSDPRRLTSSQADAIISTNPPIVWLSYGVHGNEASSPEAALTVMYELAARTDHEIVSLLQSLVVVIDPLLNPDGHERYVNYQVTRSGARPIEDKNAIEHNEDWPSGRTNHYLFDLNRDWAWLTQRESQARVRVYQEWKPQVHVDFHEMGYNSSYFFFPAFKPINQHFPTSTLKWGEIYGRANAAAFDQAGWSYWTGEFFDLYYPGYGDSWPSLNGAIGMTYEQAGQVGIRVRRSDETILTLKDRLDHHTTTSFSTLKATAEHREKLLRDFHKFFKEAMVEGRNSPMRSIIISPERDPARSAKMVSLLLQHGVEVLLTTAPISVDGLSTYFSKRKISKQFPAGSYLISADQPAKRMLITLMEEEPALSDTIFYDVSTWSLPVAFGVETYWTGKTLSVPNTPIQSVKLPVGRVQGGKATYAYVFRWNSNDAVRALAWLLQNDYRAHVAMKEFAMNNELFSRGAIILPVSNNKPDVHERMIEIAERFHITIYAAQSGFTESGINLGSDRAVRLRKPRIVVVTNSPVSTGGYGAIWSMFDLQYGIDFVPMKLAQLRSASLHDYTAIILPDDDSHGSGYRSLIDSILVQKIKTWISDGGTLIGIEGGAAFASASIGKIASVRLKEKKQEEKEGKKDTVGGKKGVLSDEELEKRMTVEERERKRRLESIPGTVFRVKLDVSHPLGFGYEPSVAVLKTTTTMFELSEKGYNVGIYTKEPRLSGYISPENEKRLEESPYLVHEQLGRGNIVLFADDPSFRLYWDGLNKLFLNSVLLMPSVRNVTLSADGKH